MSEDHARLAPSAAHRWMNCPGAPTLESAFPDQAGTYAREGTMLHNIMSSHLPMARERGDFNGLFDYLIGTEREGFTVTSEHVECLEWCADIFRYHGGFDARNTTLLEQRVRIPGRSDCYGTGDVIIVRPHERRLTLIDWKFGAGVQVDARDNEQVVIYGLGALALLDGIEEFDTVDIVIGQPRLNHHDPWTLSADELRGWLRRVLDAAERTDRETTVYVDGDWCRFCKARSSCPALRATALAAARAEFARVGEATTDQLAEAMRAIPRIEEWIRAIESETFRRMNQGDKVPGYKLGEGRRSREYTDVEAAKQFALRQFGRDGFTEPELVTPAALDKLAKKRGVELPEGLIEWKRGALKVLPEGDERPELTSAQLDFKPVGITMEDL